MTVKDVYKRGISHLPEVESDNADLQKYIVDWVNEMLIETFHVENTIREVNEEPLLEQPQVVSSLNDELEYHYSLVGVAFPYGIAAHAFIDDDNDYRSNKFGQYYVLRVNEAMKYIPKKIVDVY